LKKAIEATKGAPSLADAGEWADAKVAPVTIWPKPSAQQAFSPKAESPKPMAAQHKGAPVKLSNATELYQPVLGTSQSSVYYTFALFPGLKLAARIAGNKLSVRAEGAALIDYLDTLKDNFKMDPSSGYASAHYVVDEGAGLMVKTLAAIVGVLGFEKIEKVADLNKFVKANA
jgi:hypothetical protein